MYWRVLNRDRPSTDQKCVVAIRVNNQKPKYGIFTYHLGIDYGKWINRNQTIVANNSDCWCPVSEIIDRVCNMIIDDIQCEIDRNKVRLDSLFM